LISAPRADRPARRRAFPESWQRKFQPWHPRARAWSCGERSQYGPFHAVAEYEKREDAREFPYGNQLPRASV